MLVCGESRIVFSYLLRSGLPLQFGCCFQGAMNVKQVKEVEDICNEVSKQNKIVYTKNAPLAQAKAIQGLRAVFDEVGQPYVQLVYVKPCTIRNSLCVILFMRECIVFDAPDLPGPGASGVHWHTRGGFTLRPRRSGWRSHLHRILWRHVSTFTFTISTISFFIRYQKIQYRYQYIVC